MIEILPILLMLGKLLYFSSILTMAPKRARAVGVNNEAGTSSEHERLANAQAKAEVAVGGETTITATAEVGLA